MSANHRIKAFGMTNHMLLEDLSRLEREFSLSLGHMPPAPAVSDKGIYYEQFEASFRREAAGMSRHYEIFYCLEKSIRALISETLESVAGEDWWASGKVPPHIKTEIEARIQREIDTGMTQRSSDPLDYSNFGELSVLITSNWDLFGGIFAGNKKKAVERVLSNLNSLRGPIAHCSPLSSQEETRLEISIGDWYRLME